MKTRAGFLSEVWKHDQQFSPRYITKGTWRSGKQKHLNWAEILFKLNHCIENKETVHFHLINEFIFYMVSGLKYDKVLKPVDNFW